jgi:ubiquitin
MQIFVKTLTGAHITLDVEPTDHIADVKVKIQEKARILSTKQHLTAGGKQLQDEKILQDYPIHKNSTIHVHLRF